MASNESKQREIQDKYYSILNQMAIDGDKAGMNKILNSPNFKKLRLAAGLGKAGLASMGASGDVAMQAMQTAAGISLGAGAPTSGKELARKQKDAFQRKLNSQAGAGTGFGDVKASTGNIASNSMQLGKSAYYGSLLAGMGHTGMSAFMGPGMALSAGAGGVAGLGTGVGHLLGTSLSGTVAPVGAGLATILAAQKAGKALYNYTQKDSSVKDTSVSRTQLFTTSTSTSHLELKYGNGNLLRMQINRLRNQNQLKPGELLIANILTMIEEHTSVIPLIAAEATDSESRKNKEGGFAGHDLLQKKFGDTGDISIADSSAKKQGIFEKIFNSIELGTGNLLNTFDPGTYIQAILSGESVTKLYNEANSKMKGVDALKSEEQFAEQTGTSSTLVQAIHTTPSQIMDKANTFEAKQLSILGLISEINRFSAHELLKIRQDGFGITNSSSHGLLAQLREQNEIANLADEGFYESYFKSIDEKLGYIPGYNILSGSIKMASSGANWLQDMFLGDKTGEYDENGKSIRKKNRRLDQVFNDWLTKDAKNSVLDNEAQLRQEVGATELGPQDLMANYLGKAYPDRFELLLKYNLSQMESLESIAGPIKRSKLESLSMNKYDGVFASKQYHRFKDNDIKKKMNEQMGFLNESNTIFGQLYQAVYGEDMIASQIEDGMENNSFLKKFVKSNGKTIKSATGLGKHSKKQLSAQDAQDKQKVEDTNKHKLSLAEQQVNILQDIRDCLKCDKKFTDYKKVNKDQHTKESAENSGFGGMFDNANPFGKNKKPRTPAPKASLWKRVKNFFSIKNFKKLGIKGILFKVAKLFPMAIVGILKIPYVAALVGAGALAYGAYKYFAGKAEDEEKAKALTGKEKETYQSTKALQSVKDLLSESDATKSKGADLLKDVKMEQLADMLKNTKDPFIRGVIQLAISRLNGKIEQGKYTGNSGDYTNYIERNGSSLKKGTLNSLRHMSKREVLQFKKDSESWTQTGQKLTKKDYKNIDEIIANAPDENGNRKCKKGVSKCHRFQNSKFRFLSYVTSNFGPRMVNGKYDPAHQGIDFGAVPYGTTIPITAIAAGTVIGVTDASTGGQGASIKIRLESEEIYVYWHLASKPVQKKGDPIKVGDFVANMGNTGGGRSSGVHLHLGWIPAPDSVVKGQVAKGGYMDPSNFIFKHIKGTNSSLEHIYSTGDEYESNSSDHRNGEHKYLKDSLGVGVVVTDPLATHNSPEAAEHNSLKISEAQTRYNEARNLETKINRGGLHKNDLSDIGHLKNILQTQQSIDPEHKELLKQQINVLIKIMSSIKEGNAPELKIISIDKTLDKHFVSKGGPIHTLEK